MLDRQTIASQLDYVLKGTDFGNKYEGKVRDCYIKGEQRIMITTDRASAFDRIVGAIPFKGQILNEMTKFWFEKTKDICPNYVEDYPDPNVIVGKECEPLMVEMVIRGYITGTSSTSAWKNYQEGVRNFGGNILPDGLKKDQKLEKPIITPTTKAEQGDHDENITPEEIVESGILTREEWNMLANYTKKLFQRGTEIAKRQGLILVDTKYEFGRTDEGEIVLIDEIHTPDSSRFWLEETYRQRFSKGEEPEGLSKEFLRIWLTEQGFTGEGEVPEIPDEVLIRTTEKYIEAFELITGTEFKAEAGDVISRIEKNLTPYLK